MKPRKARSNSSPVATQRLWLTQMFVAPWFLTIDHSHEGRDHLVFWEKP